MQLCVMIRILWVGTVKTEGVLQVCSQGPAVVHILLELKLLGPQPPSLRWSPWLVFAQEKPLPGSRGDCLTPEQQGPTPALTEPAMKKWPQ